MRGEPDFPTPAHITEAAIGALQSGRTTYPDNRGETGASRRRRRQTARDNGVSYDPASEILITDGATLGIYAALMTLLNPGDESCFPIRSTTPTNRRSARGRPSRRRAKHSAKTAGSLSTRRSARSRLHAATRVLLLNTPWNPVGTVFTRRRTESHRRLRRSPQPDSDQRRDLRSDHLRRSREHISPAPAFGRDRVAYVLSTASRRPTR